MSERLTADSTYKSLLIYFDDQFIFDLIQKYNMIIDTKEEKNIISVNYKSDALFTCNVENFQQYLEQNFDTMLLKLKIEELFLQAIRLQKSSMHAFINAILSTSHDRIKFILESNIDLIQTLEDMCALTRLTQSKIRRYIKNEYNVTPKIWLDTKRLEKAELMLKNTDKSISDIATECGYATVSWFISQFKKHYKRTPKEFRHKM
jgi:AraC family transcriptional regulator, exoenzyme S synthesis regulatory protein ExsA